MTIYGMIGAVNILFTPCIALFLYYRRKGVEIKGNTKMLLQYAIMVCANLPFASTIVGILKLIFNAPIHYYSEIYVLISMITSVCLVYIYDIIVNAVSVSVEIKGNKNEK